MVDLLLMVLSPLVPVAGSLALITALSDMRMGQLQTVEDAKVHIRLYSPPVVLLWHLPRWMWRNAARVLCGMGRFAKLFFRLIIGQNRLIGAVGAMLGAMIGYLFGDLLICAAVGAGVAILLRELVAKHTLGIVPK